MASTARRLRAGRRVRDALAWWTRRVCSAMLAKALVRTSTSLLLVLLAGCGARTQLEVEPCGDAGTRACENACGEGTQACVGGTWQPCVVAPAERACEATCGAGTQQCVDGAWGACEGPGSAERACENACGGGTQSCTAAGGWQPCEVPRVTRACDATCGPGTQRCDDGGWGACTSSAVRERACSSPCGDGTQVCRDDVWGPCSADSAAAARPERPGARLLVEPPRLRERHRG